MNAMSKTNRWTRVPVAWRLRQRSPLVAGGHILTLLLALFSSSCAVHFKDDSVNHRAQMRELPTVAVIAPREYNSLMRDRGEFFLPAYAKFKDYRYVWDGGSITTPEIFEADIDAYRKADGHIDCNAGLHQAAPQNADYWLVANVYNEAESGGLSLFLSGISMTIIPAVHSGDATLTYSLYSAASPDAEIDQGAVSVNYKSLQHAFAMNASPSRIEQARESGHKMFCSLVVKSLLDAKANYAFYE